jgi:hypothetical protein
MGSSKLQPVLLGGVFIGVLSALPVIGIANCCCLWVIGGGALAAYLVQQNQPTAITVADGAVVGLLAGLIGGVIWSLLSIPLAMAVRQFTGPFLERLVRSNSDMPPEMQDFLESWSSGGAVSVLFRVISMFITIVVSTVFAMLGGILGAAIFKKGAPPSPPGTIDVVQ